MPVPAVRPARADEAATKLKRALAGLRGDLTVADAATRGALTLGEAQDGLLRLSSDYRGHLKTTEKGELLFSFPEGFRKRDVDGTATKMVKAIGRGVVGVGRFVVRAWVSVVMVGYAVALVGVLIALTLKSDNDRDGGVGDMLGGLLYVVAEALYWTFHPFSPLYLGREPAWMRQRTGRRGLRGRSAPRLPFYEKVNRFAFGPPPKVVDPREQVAKVVSEIRRLAGRVGVGDVMRVTGLGADDAGAVLNRMVVDYEGDLGVSEEGAVVYRFPALRLTAQAGRTLTARGQEQALAPAPVWAEREVARPLTGNEAGTNLLLGAVNGFNLAASGWVLANHLTIERVGQLIGEAGERGRHVGQAAVDAVAASGTPVALGLIPFLFSAALFALPLGRAVGRRSERRRVARENGRRAVLREMLGDDGAATRVIPAQRLSSAWKAAAGAEVSENQLTEVVRELGGEPDVDDAGQVIYKFEDLDRERRSLEEERREAPADERQAGEVIFSSRD